jgi:hypothetical protein
VSRCLVGVSSHREKRYLTVTTFISPISLTAPSSVATERDLRVLSVPNPVSGLRTFEISSSHISIRGETAKPMRLSPPARTWARSTQLPPPLTLDIRFRSLPLAVSNLEDPISLPCLERKRLLDCKPSLSPKPGVELSTLVAISRLSLTTTSLGWSEIAPRNKSLSTGTVQDRSFIPSTSILHNSTDAVPAV